MRQTEKTFRPNTGEARTEVGEGVMQDNEPNRQGGTDKRKDRQRVKEGTTEERRGSERSMGPTEDAATVATKQSESAPEKDGGRQVRSNVETRSAAWKRRRRLCFEDLMDEEREIGVHKWIIQAGELGQTEKERRDVKLQGETSREGVKTVTVKDRHTRQDTSVIAEGEWCTEVELKNAKIKDRQARKHISVIAPEKWCTEVELEDVTERIAAWKRESARHKQVTVAGSASIRWVYSGRQRGSMETTPQQAHAKVAEATKAVKIVWRAGVPYKRVRIGSQEERGPTLEKKYEEVRGNEADRAKTGAREKIEERTGEGGQRAKAQYRTRMALSIVAEIMSNSAFTE